MASMTKRRKLTFAVGAAAVALVLAGIAAAGAVAASWVLEPSEESKAVIDDAASQLGVESSELSAALKQALKNRIDEAVEDGRLTEEQADELEARIDADEFPLLGGLGMFGHGVHGGPGLGHFGHFGHFELLETAASYLGLTEAELRDALEDQTLAEIAEEQGKTASGLVQELVATQTKRIDEALAHGRITEEQATELKAELSERMQELVNGELRARGDGERHRFWPGAGAPRAPPSFFGGPPA
jgi:polyhydroxyalkanoate synthesis regulator phasin